MMTSRVRRHQRDLVLEPEVLLEKTGVHRKVAVLKEGHTIFRQGDTTDAVFYLQKGKSSWL